MCGVSSRAGLGVTDLGRFIKGRGCGRRSYTHSARLYTSRMRKKKQSFELTFEHTEMLEKFGDASSDYPDLSFDEIARKLLGPKPFKATTKGKSLEKTCREVFDRERE
jgi:hypothetical protein